jgi:hypothetical protein
MRAVDERNLARLRLCSLGLIAASLAACGEGAGPTSGGSLHPVSGRVTVSGRPAAGVQVRLYLLNRYHDADAPRPEATTDKEGRFRLRTGGDRDGAPSGQYVATLVWPTGPGGSDRLGGAFAEPDGSGLVALIEETTSELPPYEVVPRASRTPPAR